MTDDRSITQAIDRGVAHLCAVQRETGDWLAGWRGFSLMYHYGLALLWSGAAPKSETLQDICDQFEKMACADGGLSFAPEAPSSARITTLGTMFLSRCRPGSKVLLAAEQYLAREGAIPDYPFLLLERWLLDPENRDELSRKRLPSRALRRLAWKVAPRLLVPPRDQAPRPPTGAARRVVERAFYWLSWPLPHELERNVEQLPLPFTIPMYLSFLAVQHVAGKGPLSEGREITERLVPSLLDRYVFDDGSFYYLNALLPTLVCLRHLGRRDDERRVIAAVERIGYEKGGWVSTCMAGINTFDTALTVQALRGCGLPDDHPAIARARGFLRTAQRADGLWSWAWDPAQGPRQRLADTDDTAAAILAVHGEDLETFPRREEAVSSLRRLQAPEGGFVTFDMASAGYNPVTPSNTSRVVQALLALGLSPRDPAVRRATRWLLESQREDGSWFDFWMMNPVYGTSLALEALVATGERAPGDREVERSVHCIQRLQNADGGWGFDWYGERKPTSVVEHTALAVHALCAYARPGARPISAITGGIRFLLDRQREDGGWAATMVGQWDGQEGYASTLYPVIFALRALGAYRATMSEYLPTVPQLVRTTRLSAKAKEKAENTEKEKGRP